MAWVGCRHNKKCQEQINIACITNRNAKLRSSEAPFNRWLVSNIFVPQSTYNVNSIKHSIILYFGNCGMSLPYKVDYDTYVDAFVLMPCFLSFYLFNMKTNYAKTKSVPKVQLFTKIELQAIEQCKEFLTVDFTCATTLNKNHSSFLQNHLYQFKSSSNLHFVSSHEHLAT